MGTNQSLCSDLESPYRDSKGITLSVLLILFSCQRTDFASKGRPFCDPPSLRVKRNVSARCEPIPVDPDCRNSSLFRLLERSNRSTRDCGFYVAATVFVNQLLAAGNRYNLNPTHVISNYARDLRLSAMYRSLTAPAHPIFPLRSAQIAVHVGVTPDFNDPFSERTSDNASPSGSIPTKRWGVKPFNTNTLRRVSGSACPSRRHDSPPVVIMIAPA
jgi:hypothetical protein